MAMGAMLLSELGLSVSLEMNSLGCPVCRPGFRASLLAFLDDRQQALCDDCKRRSATNPLRVLDCKNPRCREQVLEAPSLLDHLCADCADHFSGVQEGLEQLGVHYSLNKFMVRGLDYYTRTTFEFITGDLGAQAAVGAGGRYDGLIEQLGGPQIPGIGFALGMERLVLLLQQKEAEVTASGVDLLVAGLGEQSIHYGFGLAHVLRTGGMRVAMDLEGRSLKSQMKLAGKLGASHVLILGEKELAEGKAVLRNMATQQQQEIVLQDEAGTVQVLRVLIKEVCATN
jgi:histidyl-tRNA synthetase